jgi:hypothetical protein
MDLAQAFLTPQNATHRQYEALRAYFVDQLPGPEVAQKKTNWLLSLSLPQTAQPWQNRQSGAMRREAALNYNRAARTSPMGVDRAAAADSG